MFIATSDFSLLSSFITGCYYPLLFYHYFLFVAYNHNHRFPFITIHFPLFLIVNIYHRLVTSSVFIIIHHYSIFIVIYHNTPTCLPLLLSLLYIIHHYLLFLIIHYCSLSFIITLYHYYYYYNYYHYHPGVHYHCRIIRKDLV